MVSKILPQSAPILAYGDLPNELLERLQGRTIAFDLETNRLDFSGNWVAQAQIRLATLYCPETGDVVVVGLNPSRLPYRLLELLGGRGLRIVHNMDFDVRLLAAHYGVIPGRVACTKIAARVLYPDQSVSLAALVERNLGIVLDKDDEVRLSGFSWPLTERQLNYAVQDVLYLPELLRRLIGRMDANQQRQVVRAWAELRDELRRFYGLEQSRDGAVIAM